MLATLLDQNFSFYSEPEIRALFERIFQLELIAGGHEDGVVVELSSYDEWLEWKKSNAWMFDSSHRERVYRRAQSQGLQSLWFKHIPPESITLTELSGSPPYIQGPPQIFERGRMMLDLVAALRSVQNLPRVRIYGAEAVTAWALHMRGRFAWFIGSEYARNDKDRLWLFPIVGEYPAKLSYPTGSFDVAVTQEVLEHVPDLPASLRELARILRPGGVSLSTFPFLWESEKTLVRTTVAGDGKLVHHLEQEIHANPTSEEGSLVFQTPAWDILDLAKSCGFKDARFMLYSNLNAGVIGQHINGLWCMVCER